MCRLGGSLVLVLPLKGRHVGKDLCQATAEELTYIWEGEDDEAKMLIHRAADTDCLVGDRAESHGIRAGGLLGYNQGRCIRQ